FHVTGVQTCALPILKEIESADPVEPEDIVRSRPLQLLTELLLPVVVVGFAKRERCVVAIARKLCIEPAPCRNGAKRGLTDARIERERDAVGVEIVHARAAGVR